jgi:hypothetical protein
VDLSRLHPSGKNHEGTLVDELAGATEAQAVHEEPLLGVEALDPPAAVAPHAHGGGSAVDLDREDLDRQHVIGRRAVEKGARRQRQVGLERDFQEEENDEAH